MNLELIKQIIRTKTFHLLVLCGIMYFIGWGIFVKWIEPDLSKTPGEPGMWARDLLWVIYWRWYLDWPMIGGSLGILLLFMALLNLFIRKFSLNSQKVAMIGVPIIIMAANYLGMLAIDIAITAFADVYINGTWESTELYFLGMTAQRLYHGFFFWYMPMILVIGGSLMVFLHQNRYLSAFKTYTYFMAGYALNLGFLDPVVCHYIWGNWRIFGEWSMMGFAAMWAEGWIIHYIIFAILWIIGAKLVSRIHQEIVKHK
jgi:hypothetical protein